MQHNHKGFDSTAPGVRPDANPVRTQDLSDLPTPQISRGAARGIVIAIPFAAAVWAVIIVAIRALI